MIPEKYKLKLEEGEDIYKIRYIKMDLETKATEHYTGEPDNIDMEKTYTEIETGEDILASNDDQDMTARLENAYKRPLLFKDLNREDGKIVRDIYRQLQRLRYCVQHIKYKLSIIYKNYLCVMRGVNIDMFLIKHYNKLDIRRLYVMIDLETFYEKIETLSEDIRNVKQGVFRVLDKNQHMHTNNLHRMMEEKKDVLAISENIYIKKNKYTEYLDRFQHLLHNLETKEKTLYDKLKDLNIDSNTGVKGMHDDITQAHQKAKINEEINKVEKVKRDTIKSIINIQQALENMVLSTDKAFFDNTIMMDEIFKNFDYLKTI
jgi:hypothetical protein